MGSVARFIRVTQGHGAMAPTCTEIFQNHRFENVDLKKKSSCCFKDQKLENDHFEKIDQHKKVFKLFGRGNVGKWQLGKTDF